MRTYRFPIPAEERVLLLSAAIVGASLVVGVLVLLGQVASSFGVSLGQLFASSSALRVQVGCIALLLVVGLYAIHAYQVSQNGATFEIDGDVVRLRRPGIPGLGWWSVDIAIRVSDVDRVEVERVRRGLVRRVELRVGAGRSEIAVNLERCVAAGEASAPRELPRESWRAHVLVAAVAEATGRDVWVG